MKFSEINSHNIKLYLSLSFSLDKRIQVFRSSGSIAIFAIFYIIGFFISGQQVFFSAEDIKTFLIQCLFTVMGFIIYIFFHDFIHHLFGKVLKIPTSLKFKFIFPYITYPTDVVEKRKYYIVLLAPTIVFFALGLIGTILVLIFIPSWFYLPWSIVLMNAVFSIDDLTYIVYSIKYKNCYIQVKDMALNIFVDIDKYSTMKKQEHDKYKAKILEKQARKERINQLKNAPKMGKNKYLNELKNNSQSSDDKDQDLDDLSKLD